MLLLLGLMLLVISLEEFKKDRKITGWINLVVFLLIFFESIWNFLLH
ncbi:DUF3953 domain-containing protein [Cohnella soli]|uniref:DUF3953 domain-containing protein n=1 Tax=Cohnella soli TaxID=425005 RepID=A0ABW0HUW8_9BACL